MSFKYHVGAEGSKESKIALVAEKGAWAEVSEKDRDGKPNPRPLVGPTGSYAREHLIACQLRAGTKLWDEKLTHGRRLFKWSPADNVYLTNSVHNFDHPDANPTFDDIWREQPRLIKELMDMPNLNCIIAMGNWSMASLGNMTYNSVNKKRELVGIGNWRGSVVPSIIERADGSKVKMIPTYHPSFYVNGEWRFKPIVQFDVARAVEQSKFPEIREVEREYCIRPNGIDEAIGWFDEIENDLDKGVYDFKLTDGRLIRGLAHDLECLKGKYEARYITCFSVSIHPRRAYCWPITYNNRSPYFSDLHHEAEIWKRFDHLMSREDITIIGQNQMTFDIPIERKHGIYFSERSLARAFDTQHAHNYLAADLPHDLGFLVSLYTDQRYYKGESGDWVGQKIKVPEDQFWMYNCKDSCLDLESAYGIMNDLIEAK